MRNRVRWVILLVAAMASTSLGAWNPNTDPCLVFNMDFENHTHDTNAIDSNSGLVGDVVNKAADPNTPFVSDANAKFGTSCDLRSPVDLGTTDVNSCRLTIDRWAHAENSNPLFHNVFDLGQDANTVLTFSAWFGRHDGSGTIIGQRDDEFDESYPEYMTYYWWQFRLQGGKVLMDAKSQNRDVLRMATQKTLLQMGMNNTDWHHATVVFDRRTRLSSKIYIDGAPVKVNITGHDPCLPASIPTDPPAFIGSGDNGLFDDWDGISDEIRIYRRILNDTEISLLYQWTPTNMGPWALLPLPNYTQVSTKTNLGWEPIAGADSQDLIFGTDPNLDNPNNVLVTLSDLEGDDDDATNADVNGPLDFNSVYYWRVDTNDGDIKGPVWKFTTDVGYAIDPVPADGETGVEVNIVNLQWTGSPDKLNFDVYLSTNGSVDPCADPCAQQVANHITDSNVVIFDPNLPEKGKKYYWQVVTNFGSPNMPGPVWNFRVGSIPIVVNTADFNETYNGVDYNALTITFTDANIFVKGNLGTDDVVIFNLSGHNNITEEYEFFVIPEFNDTVQDEANGLGVRRTSRPMAIYVVGDFNFDGRMNISGETVTTAVGNKTYSPYGRCGGYRGPRNNDGDAKVSPEETQYGGYWHDIDSNDRFLDALQGTLENRTRYIHFITSVTNMPVGPPTRYAASGLSMFGPGGGSSGAQNTGGGGGYGGIGGDSGHGWDFGNFEGGVPYGDKEVPVPFGGSAGGFGKNSPNPSPGASGGGGVEIATTGDITLGPNAQIVAEGGSAFNGCDYAGGGGAGGSVRLIADGNVSIAETAVISVNGGNGGNTNTADEPKAAGGGAGGRVAIWYGGTYTNTGQITADGGAPGTISGGAPSWAEAGQDGTIYVSNGDERKASAPTPRNGNKIVYVAGGAGNVTLKWYSGYGAQAVNDVVYFGINPVPGGAPVATVAATRGQHSAVVAVAAGTKYYWKVTTGGAVDSNIWNFTVVNWYCDETKFNQRAQWDTGPYNNCCVDFEDFAYFAQYWFKRNHMYWGPPDSPTDTITGAGISKFMSEWLQMTGRTP